ncbi:hypothetical protein JCM11251_004659 [Rhodosporidiobolus azoricus]
MTKSDPMETIVRLFPWFLTFLVLTSLSAAFGPDNRVETQSGYGRDYPGERAPSGEDSDDIGRMTDHTDLSDPPSRAPSPPPPIQQQQPIYNQSFSPPSAGFPTAPPFVPAQDYNSGISRPSTAPVVAYTGPRLFSPPTPLAFSPVGTGGPPPPPDAFEAQPSSAFRSPLTAPFHPVPTASPPLPQQQQPALRPMSTAQEMMMNAQWMKSNPAPFNTIVAPGYPSFYGSTPQSGYQQHLLNDPSPASPTSFVPSPPLRAFLPSSPPPTRYSPPPHSASSTGAIPYSSPPGQRFEPQLASQISDHPDPSPAPFASPSFSAPAPYPARPRSPYRSGAVPYTPSLGQQFEPRLASQEHGPAAERFQPSPTSQPQRSTDEAYGRRGRQTYSTREGSESGGSVSGPENEVAGSPFEPVREMRSFIPGHGGAEGGQGGQGRPLPGAFVASSPAPPPQALALQPPYDATPRPYFPSLSSSPSSPPLPPVEQYRSFAQQSAAPSPRPLPGAFVPRPPSTAPPILTGSPPPAPAAQGGYQPQPQIVQPYQPDWLRQGQMPPFVRQSNLPGAFQPLAASSIPPESPPLPLSAQDGPSPLPETTRQDRPRSPSLTPGAFTSPYPIRATRPQPGPRFEPQLESDSAGGLPPRSDEAHQQQQRDRYSREPPQQPHRDDIQVEDASPPYDHDHPRENTFADFPPAETAPYDRLAGRRDSDPPPADYHTDSGDTDSLSSNSPSRRFPTSFAPPSPASSAPAPAPPLYLPGSARSARHPRPNTAFAASTARVPDGTEDRPPLSQQDETEIPSFRQQDDSNGVIDEDHQQSRRPRRLPARDESLASANLSDEEGGGRDDRPTGFEQEGQIDNGIDTGRGSFGARRHERKQYDPERHDSGQGEVDGPPVRRPARQFRRRRPREDVVPDAGIVDEPAKRRPPSSAATATDSDEDPLPQGRWGGGESDADQGGFGSDEELADRPIRDEQSKQNGYGGADYGGGYNSGGQERAPVAPPRRFSRSSRYAARPRSARFPRRAATVTAPSPPGSDTGNSNEEEGDVLSGSPGRLERSSTDDYDADDDERDSPSTTYQQPSSGSFTASLPPPSLSDSRQADPAPPSSDEEYETPIQSQALDGEAAEPALRGERRRRRGPDRSLGPFTDDSDPSYVHNDAEAYPSPRRRRQPSSDVAQPVYQDTTSEDGLPQPAADLPQANEPRPSRYSRRRSRRSRDTDDSGDEDDSDENGTSYGAPAAAARGGGAAGLAGAGAYSAYNSGTDDDLVPQPEKETEGRRGGREEENGFNGEGRGPDLAEAVMGDYDAPRYDASELPRSRRSELGDYGVATDSEGDESETPPGAAEGREEPRLQGQRGGEGEGYDRRKVRNEPVYNNDVYSPAGEASTLDDDTPIPAMNDGAQQSEYDAKLPNDSQSHFSRRPEEIDFDPQNPQDPDPFQPDARQRENDETPQSALAMDSEAEDPPQRGRSFHAESEADAALVENNGWRREGRDGRAESDVDEDLRPADTSRQADVSHNQTHDDMPSSSSARFPEDARRDFDQQQDDEEKPGASYSDEEIERGLPRNDTEGGNDEDEEYDKNRSSGLAAGATGGATVGAAGAYGASKLDDDQNFNESKDPQAIPYQSNGGEGNLSDDELDQKNDKYPPQQDPVFDPVSESAVKDPQDRQTGYDEDVGNATNELDSRSPSMDDERLNGGGRKECDQQDPSPRDNLGRSEQSYPQDDQSYSQDNYNQGQDDYSRSSAVPYQTDSNSYQPDYGQDNTGYDSGGHYDDGLNAGGGYQDYRDDGMGGAGGWQDQQTRGGWEDAERGYPPSPQQEFYPPSPREEYHSPVTQPEVDPFFAGVYAGDPRHQYEAHMDDLRRLRHRRPRPHRAEVVASAKTAVIACTHLRQLEQRYGHEHVTPLPTALELGLSDSEYHTVLRDAQKDHRDALASARAAFQRHPSQANRDRLEAAEAQHRDLGDHADEHADELREKHEALLADPNAPQHEKDQAAQARHTAATHEVENAHEEVAAAERNLEELHRRRASREEIEHARKRVRNAHLVLKEAKDEEHQARQHLPDSPHPPDPDLPHKHDSFDRESATPKDEHIAAVHQVHSARDKVEDAEDKLQRAKARHGTNHPETLSAQEEVKQAHERLQVAKMEEASLRGSMDSHHRMSTAKLARDHAQRSAERREDEIREIQGRPGPRTQQEQEELRYLHGRLERAKTRFSHAESRYRREEEAHQKGVDPFNSRHGIDDRADGGRPSQFSFRSSFSSSELNLPAQSL